MRNKCSSSSLLLYIDVSLAYGAYRSVRNLEVYGYPSKENLFGQSPLLMNAMCIVFSKVMLIRSFVPSLARIAQKLKFSIKDLFSKCDQIRNT